MVESNDFLMQTFIIVMIVSAVGIMIGTRLWILFKR